jgi:hypothetical protein
MVLTVDIDRDDGGSVDGSSTAIVPSGVAAPTAPIREQHIGGSGGSLS